MAVRHAEPSVGNAPRQAKQTPRVTGRARSPTTEHPRPRTTDQTAHPDRSRPQWPRSSGRLSWTVSGSSGSGTDQRNRPTSEASGVAAVRWRAVGQFGRFGRFPGGRGTLLVGARRAGRRPRSAGPCDPDGRPARYSPGAPPGRAASRGCARRDRERRPRRLPEPLGSGVGRVGWRYRSAPSTSRRRRRPAATRSAGTRRRRPPTPASPRRPGSPAPRRPARRRGPPRTPGPRSGAR